MSLPNISCLKTDQTFKNKQSLARTKRVLKHFKRVRSSSFSSNITTMDRNNSKVSAIEDDNNKWDVSLTSKITSSEQVHTCQRGILVNLCFIGTALITFLSNPSGAVEIEGSVSINKPIMRDVPDLPGWVRFSPEYVRCFCNLPACVATGYMCKSSGGGCFSDLLDQANQALPSNVYRGIHGCLELLTDRDQRNWCQNSPSSTTKSTYRKKNHPKSLLLCCYHDMCNHADSPETRVLLNETTLGDTVNESDNRIPDNVGTKQDPALYTESEVWFRAATIAVPICGAVILLALIGVAVRLLRTESSSNSNHKLGMPSYMLPPENKANCEKIHHQTYRHHNIIRNEPLLKDSHHNPIYLNDTEDMQGQTYVPLLIPEEMRIVEKGCDKKNETNAKLNFIQDLEHHPVTYDDTAIVSQNLFHKNTDIHVGRNMIMSGNAVDHQDLNVDKIYNKESIP